ncbi:MAG: class I SAM-dependent methyltransferase [Myxococcales bacterium]|nr:class I SAM-dependent methyltransferase [Myxococcales bacterium]
MVDRLRVGLYEKFNPSAPWLTKSAVEFLDEWISRNDTVVEFGSGRSTLWFAERARRVISTEHDAEWYSHVSDRLEVMRLGNVEYFLAHVEPTSYLSHASEALSGFADLILVDGQAREHCATWAIGRIRPGGLIVVDNSNWFLPRATRSPASVGACADPLNGVWGDFHDQTRDWRCYWTSNGVSDTAIYFAPGLSSE